MGYSTKLISKSLKGLKNTLHTHPHIRRPPHIHPHIRRPPHIHPHIRRTPHTHPHIRRTPHSARTPHSHPSIRRTPHSIRNPTRTPIRRTPHGIKNPTRRTTKIKEEPHTTKTNNPKDKTKLNNKLREEEQPPKSWKDKLRDGLGWLGDLGNLAFLGLTAYELMGGGNESYAEESENPYEDSPYEDYGDMGGYGDGGYYDSAGYGDDSGYNDTEDTGGFDDLVGGDEEDATDQLNPDDYTPIDNNGDGEPDYYYNPDTGETLTSDEYNNKDIIDKIADKIGVPKEALYIGGALACMGGIYYYSKHKKKKKA